MPPTDSKSWALLCGGALLSVMAAPVRRNWRADKRDGFPLSHYPMFSARRGTHGTVVHLRARYRDGRTEPVPYHVAGGGGFNQVRRQIHRRATGLPGGANALAADVRARLLARPRSAEADLVEVQVVRARFEYRAFFAGDRLPDRVKVLGRAPLRALPPVASSSGRPW